MAIPMSEGSQELLDTAAFGKAVEQFWDSRIGQYLLEKSLEEYNSALEEFKVCNASDTARIVRIQGMMWRAEGFRDWLSQAITNGMKALDILEGNNDVIE